MAKSPAFQFYPKEYMTDEAVMLASHEEKGIYLDLLCCEWLEGSLPEDLSALARLAGTTLPKLKKAWKRFGNKFKPHPEEFGRLIHPRLEKEREKQAVWAEKSRIGGQLSGISRRKKSKGGSTTARTTLRTTLEPNHEPNANIAVCSLPLPPTPPPDNGGGGFPQFWERYPLKVEKRKAAAAYADRIREGADHQAIMGALEAYLKWAVANGRKLKHPATFLEPDGAFLENWEITQAQAHVLAGGQEATGREPFQLDPKFKQAFTPDIQPRKTFSPQADDQEPAKIPRDPPTAQEIQARVEGEKRRLSKMAENEDSLALNPPTP